MGGSELSSEAPGTVAAELSLRCIFPLGLNGAERLPAFQTATLASRSNQSAKWTHPLRSNFLGFRLERLQQLSEKFQYRSQTPAESGTIRFHAMSPLRVLRELRQSRPLKHDRASPTILCRIAHIPSARMRTEQFRPAITFRLSDYECRDEHFFSLFQVF